MDLLEDLLDGGEVPPVNENKVADKQVDLVDTNDNNVG